MNITGITLINPLSNNPSITTFPLGTQAYARKR